MAEPFDTLLQVQAHDTTLDQLHHRWETLPERAALAAEAARRRALAGELAEVQAAVDDLVARQRALEERIASSARRRHELEERMRTGAAFAPRDLQAMDHEVHQLEERQRHLEEEEITLLEEEEPLDEALAGHRRTEAELAAEMERLEAAIAEAGVTIRAAVAEEEQQRAACAARLPSDLAERYERLRSHLGGVGAARLVGDRCDGCHLTLPSVEVERIRGQPTDVIVSCPQCDRILVHA